MIDRTFHAMGCRITAWLDSNRPEAAQALERLPLMFENWEQSLSRFREDSELCRVNQRPGRRQNVSETFWQILQTAVQMERLSQGLVTPTLLSALEQAGYTRDFSLISFGREATLIDPGLNTQELSEIRLFPETRQIILPRGMRLDFGGTAKGWAAHQATEYLSVFGPAMVNAGGDISINKEKIRGKPWQAGIIDPLQPGMDLVRFALSNGGLATSGKDYRKWLQNGVLQHHIIDPRTGKPADTDILTASVIAPTVMEAEMAAKTIFILGSDEGGEWIRNRPDLASLVVLDSGDVLASQNLTSYLWRENETVAR